MSGGALAAIRAMLNLFSNGANKHEHIFTSYTVAVHYLFKRWATDAVITKTDEEIRNGKIYSLAPQEFS